MAGLRTKPAQLALIAAAIVAGILGIGFATYFFGGGLGTEPKIEPVRQVPFAFKSVPAAPPLRVSSEFTVPMGGRRGVAVGADGLSSLETVFAGTSGLTYVVDHVEQTPGARVRAYRAGRLVAQHDAPPGSTLFARVGDGFGYVVAKGETDSERVVLVNNEGTVEASYTVPMMLNSGGLVESGTTLYALAWSGFVNPDTNEVTGQDVLVPVALSGKQATDQQAQDGMLEAWRVGGDSGMWRHSLRTTPRPEATDETQRLLEVGGMKLEIPYEAWPLGVDGQGRAWVLLPPHRVTERAVAGWPAVADEYSLLAVLSKTGKILGALSVRTPEGLFLPDIARARRIGFDGTHLTVADRTVNGVVVTTWEVLP